MANAALPKVALLVPAYNCQEDLNASIRDLPVEEPLHILVVDDGSMPPLVAPPCDPLHSVEIVHDFPRNAAGKTLKRTLRDPWWAGRERQI